MLGAKVEIVLSGETVLRRRSRTDGSYCSSLDPRVLVGIGRSTRVETVRVHWPSGGVEEWKSPAIDRYTVLKEGTASKKK
jgi:hypothetical protein